MLHRVLLLLSFFAPAVPEPGCIDCEPGFATGTDGLCKQVSSHCRIWNAVRSIVSSVVGALLFFFTLVSAATDCTTVVVLLILLILLPVLLILYCRTD